MHSPLQAGHAMQSYLLCSFFIIASLFLSTFSSSPFIPFIQIITAYRDAIYLCTSRYTCMYIIYLLFLPAAAFHFLFEQTYCSVALEQYYYLIPTRIKTLSFLFLPSFFVLQTWHINNIILLYNIYSSVISIYVCFFIIY